MHLTAGAKTVHTVTVIERVSVLEFHQYGREDAADVLYLVAAPARQLAQWAGVPRKGWRIRMLYQRWMAPKRRRELAEFWNRAATAEVPILGPTAITLALQEPVQIEDKQLILSYTSPINLDDHPVNNLRRVAEMVAPRVEARLESDEQRDNVGLILANPHVELPAVGHDYVYEFALQLAQMRADPEWFIDDNEIEEEEVRDMIVALEALCRPALVVDGQHRLLGAAEADVEIVLPVILMPNSSWVEQIYQFIVINEKAQKVETSQLTDIFGSSLSRPEQERLRDRLARAKVDVEARIAAIIADRDNRSPFHQMVLLKLGGKSTQRQGFVSELTVRLLIDGTTRYARGWRSDDEFYSTLVEPNIPDRAEWDSWTDGAWREYWFSFWKTVRDFYNAQAQKEKSPPLWAHDRQTNLTKAVTLRILQKLFIDKMIEEVRQVERVRPILVEAMGEAAAEAQIAAKIRERLLPIELSEFPEYVRSRFLNFIPVRIFLQPWVRSLDDDQGRQELYNELRRAYDTIRDGQTFYIRRTSSPIYETGSAAGASDGD